MRRLYEFVHSPAALLAFEAAARRLSFTRAARELNVSQPAISQSVKKIEEALGISLFERRGRGIALTEAGERFHTDVSFGLMHILRSAEGIALRAGSDHVSLSCSTAFAHYWMVPRLSDFKSAYPGIEIRVQTTDRDHDLGDEGVSFAVRRGTGPFPGHESFLLARERIYPVASPRYIAAQGRPSGTWDLARHALIHLEEPFRLRPSWTDWLDAEGVSFADDGGGLRLNDYALVVQAAIAGEGIAFGWHHIVEGLVRQGLLVKLMDGAYDAGMGFHVVWRGLRPGSRAEPFLSWLRSQAE